MIRLAMLCALPALMAFPAVAADTPWGRFSSTGGMVVRGDTHVEIWRTRDGFALRRSSYASSSARPEDIRIDWADGRTCPAVETSLAKLPALPMPTFKIPKPLGVPASIRDGNTYTLEAGAGWDGAPAHVRLTTDWPSPLGSWVVETLRSVATCWRPDRPDNISHLQ